jgi:hypothetical protein
LAVRFDHRRSGLRVTQDICLLIWC